MRQSDSRLRTPPCSAAVIHGDLNLLRCFSGSLVPTVVLSEEPGEVTLLSRHCRASQLVAKATKVDDLVADLISMGERFAYKPVLYYGNDAVLLAVSRNRALLEPWYHLNLPPPELIEALVDKNEFAALAERSGLPIPKSRGFRQVRDVARLAADVPGPYIVKPNVHIGWFGFRSLHGSGPRKALRADTVEALGVICRQVCEHTDDFIVQQFVPGGEEQIYSYHAYLDRGGRTLGRFVGKKIRTFPMEAGVSTYLELVDEPEVIRIGDDAVARLGLVGPVKIDFKRDVHSGSFYILEFNPRFNLWHYLGAASGVNLPMLAYADLTGQKVAPQLQPRIGMRWLSLGNDLRSYVRSYRKEGQLGLAQYLSSFRGDKIYDVFAWDDPVPFVASVARYWRSLGGRVLRTVTSRPTGSPRLADEGGA